MSKSKGFRVDRAQVVAIESLEARSLLSVVPIPLFLNSDGAAAAPAQHHHHARHHHRHAKPHLTLISGGDEADGHAAAPQASTGPSGYSPQQVRAAYGFDQVVLNGVVADGAGQTIAIVDAYDAPTIAGDLSKFDAQFGLPGTTTNAAASDPNSVYTFFTKVNQNGGTAYPKANAGWAQETSLDVEWAHAIAPAAKILLVEASSNSFSNLLAAVDYAKAHANIVSMSWGSSEFSGETGAAYDGHFKTSGVSFVASAGDSGGVRSWPAVSPNVISVGGTALNATANGTYVSETGWSSGGGGTSAYELKPGYQSSLTYTRRSTPDIGYNADPYTGVAVYDSYAYRGASGWLVFGGTSAGAPQWAGLLALANQGRGAALDGYSQVLPALYALNATTTSYLHDVTSGQSSSTIKAGPGYDQITGQGTPVASQLVDYLSKVGAATP